MAVLDRNRDPLEVGDFVQMIPSLTNHDIVKGVPYEITVCNDHHGINLRHYYTREEFVGRAPSCFFKIDPPGGPW